MVPHCEVREESSLSACATAREAEERKPRALGGPADTALPIISPVCRERKEGAVAGVGVRRGMA